jgi:hypothetical protein
MKKQSARTGRVVQVPSINILLHLPKTQRAQGLFDLSEDDSAASTGARERPATDAIAAASR